MDKLFELGLVLIILGIAVIALGSLAVMLLQAHHAAESTSVEGGGAVCIVVFFVPICFGAASSGTMWLVMVLAMVLTLVVVAIAAVMALEFVKKTKVPP